MMRSGFMIPQLPYAAGRRCRTCSPLQRASVSVDHARLSTVSLSLHPPGLQPSRGTWSSSAWSLSSVPGSWRSVSSGMRDLGGMSHVLLGMLALRVWGGVCTSGCFVARS